MSTGLVVMVNASGAGEAEVADYVTEAYFADPLSCVNRPVADVTMYTGGGLQRIYEISLDYGASSPTLSSRKDILEGDLEELAARVTAKGSAYRALQARDAFVNEHGKEPTIDEIAKKIDLPREDVIFALDAIADPISLFEPISNESGDPVYMMDMVGDENYGEKTWLESLNIREGLSKLGEREKKIINLRFFVGKTQMEVAEEIGISQAQVSRLENGA
ncbi:MAG: helix-turn-helix domain-containing protein [Firmicutes bacterium]|nr:helix-turn-helix domain-containing protein [Bacillota bacterium]